MTLGILPEYLKGQGAPCTVDAGSPGSAPSVLLDLPRTREQMNEQVFTALTWPSSVCPLLL